MKFLIAISALALTLTTPLAAPAQTSEQIREAQALLVRTDRNPGPIDGVWGGRTEAALIDFLTEQGEAFDGELSENELVLLRAAPFGEAYRNRPHTSNGRPVEHFMAANGLTTFPGRDELPQWLNPPPNDVTLSFFFNAWLRQRTGRARYEVLPAGNAIPFESDLRDSTFLDQQLRESSMLSYLYYEDGQILYDGLAPSDRFPHFDLTRETEFRSQSVGKSFVSYVVGHAICEGYIDGLDTTLADWPLIADTLYAERTIEDLLAMRARDHHVVTEDDGFVETGRWFNGEALATFASAELAGTEPNRRDVWNYNGLVTNIALNYAVYRTGDEWQALLDHVFQDHVGIEGRFTFQQHRRSGDPALGMGWYSAYATRYDYLRIAVAMLNDWHSETCIGQYLRDLYAARQPMGHNFDDPSRMTDVAQSYGGQFWFDFRGMRDRPLFGMNGNNGQNVLIDMERRRIVVVNAAHTNFDWRTLVYEAIRDGRLPD